MPRHFTSAEQEEILVELLRLTGPRRWIEDAETMASLLAAETWKNARGEYRSFIRLLRIDVKSSLRHQRAELVRSRAWSAGLLPLIALHVASHWHLVALRFAPALLSIGFPCAADEIKTHALAAARVLRTARPSA